MFGVKMPFLQTNPTIVVDGGSQRIAEHDAVASVKGADVGHPLVQPAIQVWARLRA